MTRFLLALILLTVPLAAHADSDHDAARRALERGEVLPLSEILAIVGRDLDGAVIEVEFETKLERHIYEFKLITPDGKIAEVYVDAATGAIIKTEDKSN